MMGLILLMAVGAAQAQNGSEEPIITDRPDFTESPFTVPFRRIQLETGYTFSRTGNTDDHTLGEILLRIGAGRRAELRLGLNSLQITRGPGGTTSGWQDMSLGFKVKLLDGAEEFAKRPDIALIGALTLPTGATAFRENRVQPEMKLCFNLPLSERLAVASNLNFGVFSEGGSYFGQFAGTLSFSYALTEKLGSFLEYFGFLPGSRGGPNTNYINGGFSYLVNNDTQLDLRAGFGLNSVQPEYFIGFGVARRW